MHTNGTTRMFLQSTSALLVAAAIIFFANNVSAETVFSDVEPGNENFVAIQYLKNKGLIEGYEDGTFQPYQEINRAEGLKVLMGAIPNTEASAEEEFFFPDVSPTEWFFSYVVDAWENGLVQGYPDGLFHPENTINKAESLKIALIQEDGFIPQEATAEPYTDVSTDEWYAPYAEVAKNRTIFLESRSNGSLNADELMNRGDFAEMIYRILKSANGSVFARTTWYGNSGVNWGTASGEKFDYLAMTAAHKTLPFGTMIRVTNLANGKQVDVKINDRGPYPTGIDLDLTQGAFEKIASVGAGIITCEYEIIEEAGVEEEAPAEEDANSSVETDEPTADPDELPNISDYGF